MRLLLESYNAIFKDDKPPVVTHDEIRSSDIVSLKRILFIELYIAFTTPSLFSYKSRSFFNDFSKAFTRAGIFYFYLKS
jgi:hypothetical protein